MVFDHQKEDRSYKRNAFNPNTLIGTKNETKYGIEKLSLKTCRAFGELLKRVAADAADLCFKIDFTIYSPKNGTREYYLRETGVSSLLFSDKFTCPWRASL